MILRLSSFIRHKLVYDIIKFYIFIILVARRYHITIEPFSGMVFSLRQTTGNPKRISIPFNFPLVLYCLLHYAWATPTKKCRHVLKVVPLKVFLN